MGNPNLGTFLLLCCRWAVFHLAAPGVGDAGRTEHLVSSDVPVDWRCSFHLLFNKIWVYRTISAAGCCHKYFSCLFVLLQLRSICWVIHYLPLDFWQPKSRLVHFSPFSWSSRLPMKWSERWIWNPKRFFLLRARSDLISSKALPLLQAAKLKSSKLIIMTQSWFES